MGKWLINNWATILIVIGFVAGYYNYLKANDPKLAEKIKVIGDLANYAVSLQNTKDYSNKEKQAEATKAVMDQAEKVGIKITEATAKGAVEQAVARQKQANDIPSTTPSAVSVPAKQETELTPVDDI